MQLRWRGELDTTAIIRSIANSGESSAIPALLSYALVPYSEVQDAARIAISTLYEQMSPSQLVPLDEALRAAWAHVEDWYGQKVPIKNLKVGESRDLILLGLMCSHRSGFVRADAIGALGKAESEKAIPFLMIRLIDWVEKVRLDADVELIKKIKPRFASSFVRYLGLLRRLTLHSRFRPGYRDSIHNMLKDPTCSSDVVAGLESNDQTVRREAYVIAVGNPAIQAREVVARALKEKDVVIRSWAFSDGLAVLPPNEFDWARIAANDAYAPIRDKGFSRMASSSASTEDLAPFLFDRCTGNRRTCQSVLKQLGLSVSDIYRAALTKESAKQTEVAALGLGETGDANDGSRLLNLLSHSSARVRAAAIRAMGFLKIQQIEEPLLERVRSDSRGVSREAASLLLQRKFATPRVIWKAAQENRPDVQLSVLQQMWRVNKWAQLSFYLEASLSDVPGLVEFAVERLAVWEGHFNKTFTQPEPNQVSELSNLLHQAEGRLPAPLIKRIDFVLSSFIH